MSTIKHPVDYKCDYCGEYTADDYPDLHKSDLNGIRLTHGEAPEVISSKNKEFELCDRHICDSCVQALIKQLKEGEK